MKISVAVFVWAVWHYPPRLHFPVELFINDRYPIGFFGLRNIGQGKISNKHQHLWHDDVETNQSHPWDRGQIKIVPGTNRRGSKIAILSHLSLGRAGFVPATIVPGGRPKNICVFVLISWVEKLTRSSLKGLSNRAIFAYKNGRFASRFLLFGLGFSEASKKANLSFKSPSPKPHLNRTGSVLALPIIQKRKISPKRKFSAGRPCGHPAKNFGQALQVLENKHFGTDMPRGRPRKNFGLKNLGLIFRSLIIAFSHPTLSFFSLPFGLSFLFFSRSYLLFWAFPFFAFFPQGFLGLSKKWFLFSGCFPCSFFGKKTRKSRASLRWRS